mmetsp:Transcript_55/g.148  ORF Transcript_55/g.148 Transcript_55/m.148 type:complete len:80 (-) Transcript_55:310-549(-)
MHLRLSSARHTAIYPTHKIGEKIRHQFARGKLINCHLDSSASCNFSANRIMLCAAGCKAPYVFFNSVDFSAFFCAQAEN